MDVPQTQYSPSDKTTLRPAGCKVAILIAGLGIYQMVQVTWKRFSSTRVAEIAKPDAIEYLRIVSNSQYDRSLNTSLLGYCLRMSKRRRSPTGLLYNFKEEFYLASHDQRNRRCKVVYKTLSRSNGNCLNCEFVSTNHGKHWIIVADRRQPPYQAHQPVISDTRAQEGLKRKKAL